MARWWTMLNLSEGSLTPQLAKNSLEEKERGEERTIQREREREEAKEAFSLHV